MLKQMTRCLLLIIILLNIAVASCSDTKHDQLLGFEILDNATGFPKGWARGIGQGSSGLAPDVAIRVDSLVKQEGRYSLLLSAVNNEDFASVVYSIPKSFNGEQVKLTAYLKTKDVNGWAGLWMRIDGAVEPIEFDNMMGRPVRGTTDWNKYEVELPYNKEQARAICFGALLVGTGKIWIDNFHLTIDGVDIDRAETYTREPTAAAEIDTAHYRGSGISRIVLTQDKIEDLTNLGMLWGFIKYYHADVQDGKYNMDAELFRVLPKVLAAKSTDEAHQVLEHWVDGFGVPAKCTSCKSFISAEAVQKPDYGLLFQPANLPQSLVAKLEYIRDNRYHQRTAPGKRSEPESDFSWHYYVGLYAPIGNPAFRNEYPYPDLQYPDAGVRLLALYRYWNMIQYFFPYRHLIGEDWNKVLADAMPEFCSAKDATAYQVACLKLIARINDSHAGLWDVDTKIPQYKGLFITPFHARFVEDKLVVTGWYKDTLDVKSKILLGDVIESIDGAPVKDLVNKYLPLTPASNYATKLRDMVSLDGFLLRSSRRTANIELTREGKKMIVELPRILAHRSLYSSERELFAPVQGVKLLAGNIGYIYPALLTDESLDGVKRLLHPTKGLVIDLRCYPGTAMPFTYGQWLKSKSSPFVYFTRGSTDVPGMFVKNDTMENGGENRDAYKGKVVILVNATTQSQAEYTAMAFQTIPGAVTIGSMTAGADGDVSEITLPGGLRTMISGIAILYPDGTETQRKGVKIDREVQPTIKGIKEGRDEVLQAALAIINRN